MFIYAALFSHSLLPLLLCDCELSSSFSLSPLSGGIIFIHFVAHHPLSPHKRRTHLFLASNVHSYLHSFVFNLICCFKNCLHLYIICTHNCKYILYATATVESSFQLPSLCIGILFLSAFLYSRIFSSILRM